MTFPTSRGGVALLACGVALCATLLLAGCRAGDGTPNLPTTAPPVTAPPQKAARLALVRLLDIITVGADGGGREKLTGRSRLPGVKLLRVANPAWSPDARAIYFTGTLAERRGARYFYYETDVFVMHADGSDLHRLTRTGDASLPVASPDGKTIAFARVERPGAFPVTSSLWLMNTDGTGRKRLVNSNVGQIDTPGAWAPDGRTFVFTRCRFTLPRPDGLIPNRCAIYAQTRGRTDVQRLADRAAAPAYSPDGTRIAFVSDRDENGTIAAGEDENRYADDLYVMDSNGSRQRRLTKTNDLNEQSPSWSPNASWIAYAREGPARFTAQVMLIRTDGTCPTRIIGNAAMDATDGSASFTEPRWRPGEITGPFGPSRCHS